MGDPQASLASFQRAWSLDPRSRIIGNNMAWLLDGLGRRPEALELVQQVLGFAPDFPDVISLVMHLNILAGQCQAAELFGNQLASLLEKTVNATAVYLDLCQSDNPEDRANAIETILSWPSFEFSAPDHPTLSYPRDMTVLLVELGEYDSALALVKKSREQDLSFVLTQFRSNRTANSITFYCDPRFQALYECTGIPPLEGDDICN